MTQLIDTVELKGGLDEITIPIMMSPGELIACVNFEPGLQGGYRRIAGYERFDGHESPHKANVAGVEVVDSSSIDVGDTIEGGTSGNTAVVISKDDGVLWYTKQTNASGFQGGEAVLISSVPVTTVADPSPDMGGLEYYTELLYLASNEYRSDISEVPGEGPIRGVWEYKNDVYAIRDNVGATAGVMHKATPTGWQPLAFGRELKFENATGAIKEGDTITGATSGATGVVVRALLRVGTWSANGAGTVVFDTVSGVFQDGEQLEISSVSVAESDGADTAIELPPGGKYDFDNYNFTGSTATYRMYMANGVGTMHEFDGTRLVPIHTGAPDDKPAYVKGYKSHLACILDSSVMVSSIGDPYQWDVSSGAAEIALGETGTGLLVQVGDSQNNSLIVSTSSKIYVLYGDSQLNFSLVLHSPEVGAQPWSLQNLGEAFFVEPRGITRLRASDTFGGFDVSLLTRKIQPTLDGLRGTQLCSYVVRDSNQYRVCFSSGVSIAMQLPQKGLPPVTRLVTPAVFNTVCSSVFDNGEERIFAGGMDGFVYELERGTSFDGQSIDAGIFTTFNTSRSPRDRKRYRRGELWLQAGLTARMDVAYSFSWGDIGISVTDPFSKLGGATGGFWDMFNWDIGRIWDSSYSANLPIDMPGTGNSISILITSGTPYDQRYTIHTLFLHYLPGRQAR